MKPIQKGMTTAVTRGELEAAAREGRAPVADVTQLTWFEGVDDEHSVYGVYGTSICQGLNEGEWVNTETTHDMDIFALPEYEWQWILQYNDGYFGMTNFYKTKEEVQEYQLSTVKFIEPYEPSKREVE